MPIYEYLCGECKHQFEVKQGFNDLPLSTCQRCGGGVTKLISAPAIMFKGTGWYVTDYSDKLKPTGEDASGDKPVDGKKDQKDKKDAAPAPAAAGATSESSGASSSKPSSGSSSGESTSGGSSASTPPSSPSSSSSSSTPSSTGSSSS